MLAVSREAKIIIIIIKSDKNARQKIQFTLNLGVSEDWISFVD